MGSATTSARTAMTSALRAASGVDLGVARDLFAAVRTLAGSAQLSGALADSAAPTAARTQVVQDVFRSSVSPVALGLLTTAVGQRWSSAADLLAGVEDLAVRAAAAASPEVDVDEELFDFSRTVAQNPELELALGSRLGDDAAKGGLVDDLLGSRASAATTLIVSSLVQQSRGRRVRGMLSEAMKTVADQRSRTLATVFSAVELNDAQMRRLAASLSDRYGVDVSLNVVIEPSVVGGLRVQIADDVIDASVSSRINDLRQRLAG